MRAEATKKNYTVFLEDLEFESKIYSDRILNKDVNEFESLLSIDASLANEGPSFIGAILKPSHEEKFLRLDQVKIFEHFMKFNNINTVSANYEKACAGKTYRKRIMTKRIKKRL